MRRKSSLQRTLRDLRYIIRESIQSDITDAAKSAWGRLKNDIELLEQEIAEAKMVGARNPAFDDDLVGWLDDDFDELDVKELTTADWIGRMRDKFEHRARTYTDSEEKAYYALMADRLARLASALAAIEEDGRKSARNDD